MMRAEELRDCKAWKDEGLGLSTTSNEAAKLYDLCLSQYVGWYEDPQMGGMEKTFEKLFDADPNFVLAKALNLGLQLLGTSDTIYNNPSLKAEYDSLLQQTKSSSATLSERESLHVRAVSLWAQGSPSLAARAWADILIEWPTDIHALKMSHDTYFFIGDAPRLRDSVARVLPFWEAKRPPLKSYIYGFYAFGLEENNHYERAEHYGKKGLEENRYDGWATHSLAHVFEMEGRIQEGIDFMTKNPDWEKLTLACHNHWHVSLYHLENEDYEVAASILDKKLLTRAMESKSMFDIVDCTSLQWRLNMLDPSYKRQNNSVVALADLCRPHTTRHVTTFNDAHFMMALLDENSTQDCSDLLETYKNVSSRGELVNHPTVGASILQAFVDYRDEKYEKVVDLLEPIRGSEITPIGGSNAQRDVFNLMLIVAALKSSNPRHGKLARVLINEREALKGRRTRMVTRLGALADGLRA